MLPDAKSSQGVVTGIGIVIKSCVSCAACGILVLAVEAGPASAAPPAAAVRLQLTPIGAAASDWFGWSVSSAGDVNGDGYADVIVGANLNDAGGADAGGAYVYDRNRDLLVSPDRALTWDVAATILSSSEASAGAVVGVSVDGEMRGALLQSRWAG